MAKADGVSFLERHVEKFVLGVCLILLVLAISHWVSSSPVAEDVLDENGRRIKKGVPPEQIDEVLQDAARSVERMYRSSEVPVEPVPKWAARTKQLQDLAMDSGETIELATPRQPLRAGAGGTPTKIPRPSNLQAVIPAPPKPAMQAYLELPDRDPLADHAVARGVLKFPLGALALAWAEKLEKTNIPKMVVIHNVIVEVQQALPGGKWTAAKAIVAATRPGKDGKPVVPPEIPDFDGANGMAVQKVRNDIAKNWQKHILQPAYHRIWLPAQGGWREWSLHLEKPKTDDGEELIWFHDDSTMAVGGRYRYRVKLVFVNPMLTYDQVAKKHPEDAKLKFIESDFGEWSDEVSLDREVHFFLTGSAEMMRRMSVTVFAYKWGQWVRQGFRVQPGEPIGRQDEAAIRDPRGEGGALRKIPADFTTGAVALRFDFRKMIVRRGIRTRTAEMVYLGPDARIDASVQARDVSSQLRAKLEQEYKKAMGQ